MDSEKRYRYHRRREHPPHLACACRKSDVDACLERLGLEPGFHRLWIGPPTFGVPKELRRPVIPRLIEVAEASLNVHYTPSEGDDYRRATLNLRVFVVPIQIVGVVREALRREGLPTLIRWVEDIRRLPETAFTRNRALHLEYDTESRELSTRHGETKLGSRHSP